MKIYLSGPMRGKPQFNFPAFHKAAQMLREAGHEVFNPAERDEQIYGADFSTRSDTSTFNLREALAADCAYISLQAEGIAMLPGWNRSKGAQAELALARALELEIIWLEE